MIAWKNLKVFPPGHCAPEWSMSKNAIESCDQFASPNPCSQLCFEQSVKNYPPCLSKKVKNKWRTKKKGKEIYQYISEKRKSAFTGIYYKQKTDSKQNSNHTILAKKRISLTHEGRTNPVSAGKCELYSLSFTMIKLYLKTGKTKYKNFHSNSVRHLSSQHLVLLFCWQFEGSNDKGDFILDERGTLAMNTWKGYENQ
jgi:hypothetical protein